MGEKSSSLFLYRTTRGDIKLDTGICESLLQCDLLHIKFTAKFNIREIILIEVIFYRKLMSAPCWFFAAH